MVSLHPLFISSPPSGPWAPATPAVNIDSEKELMAFEIRPCMESVARRAFRMRVTLTRRLPDLVRAKGTIGALVHTG